jgi:hypothetical protein
MTRRSPASAQKRQAAKVLTQQFTRTLPNVAVVLPSGDDVKKSHSMALASLTANSILAATLALIDVRGSIIDMLRNDGVHRAMTLPQTRPDYLLWIDSDMDFPPDALVRLLGYKKDVVGAIYQRRSPPFDTVGQLDPSEKDKDLLTAPLIKATKLGFGFILVKASVFDRIGFPWFKVTIGEKYGEGEGEDYHFCRRCKEEGIEIWADMRLSFEVGHEGRRRVVLGQPDEAEAYEAKGMSSAA